jgi:hypothetical protein
LGGKRVADWSVILQVLTLILLLVGGYLVVLFKVGAEAAIKASAQEGVKAAIRELEWPKALARELQKSRGVERQGLRFKSYGGLWKELRPLAIYDPTVIDNKAAGDLLTTLSTWYFSECGGLLLTPQSRDFYFALQDLLRIISKIPDWSADRSEEVAGSADGILREVLKARNVSDAISVLEYFAASSFEDWDSKGTDLGKVWRGAVRELGAAWEELTERQRFAALQQVGSKLRTGLVNDLESRER